MADPAPARGRLWLTGARLFDGTGAPAREGAAVLVEDGIIRHVGDASQPCPDGARQLDVGRRTLMPGLIDAHTHASGRIPQVLRGAEAVLPGTAAHFLQAELRGYLRHGVTTIRVTGSQGLAPQEARQAMRYGAFRGARVLTCGKIISATAPGGRFYGDMYREADGPDDVRRAAREQIRAGADFIKVMTTGARSNEMEDPDPLQLTEAELAAVTNEAHRLGYRVSATPRGWTAVRRRSATAPTPSNTACTCTSGRICWRPWRPPGRSWCPPCRGTTGWPGWATWLIPPGPGPCRRCRRC
jgi:imidazolonepropionase-like amidohydrolase